jgi:hypothetical protein
MSLHERISHENAWRKSNEAPTIAEGTDLEQALLGKPSVQSEEVEYMSFQEAADFVKEHQQNLPGRSRALRELRNEVAADCKDKTKPVKFFTAVGTSLDIYHGVDGFFEQDGRIATLDVSMREKESYKADVLLVASLDEEGNIVVDDEEIKHVAAKIAAKIDASPEQRAA